MPTKENKRTGAKQFEKESINLVTLSQTDENHSIVKVCYNNASKLLSKI